VAGRGGGDDILGVVLDFISYIIWEFGYVYWKIRSQIVSLPFQQHSQVSYFSHSQDNSIVLYYDTTKLPIFVRIFPLSNGMALN